MNKIVFYETKIKHNIVRIAKVRRVKAGLERLYSDISSTFLQSANGSLDLVIAELLAENKHVEALLKEERLLTPRALDETICHCSHDVYENVVNLGHCMACGKPFRQ